MYYEMEGTRSVRTENWKYIARRSPDGPSELYHMADDPMERVNLYGQAGYEEKTKELAAMLDAWFEEYADPQYDIWKGGRSKARRHIAPKGHPDYREWPKPRKTKN